MRRTICSIPPIPSVVAIVQSNPFVEKKKHDNGNTIMVRERQRKRFLNATGIITSYPRINVNRKGIKIKTRKNVRYNHFDEQNAAQIVGQVGMVPGGI